jgi:hypothetical protein
MLGLVAVPAAAQAQAPAPEDDPDLDLSVSQPDFTVWALPTTLRMPRFKSSFRVTHRFGRSLGAGDFSDLAGDAFGLDSGAQIGLEYRFGLMRGLQVGVRRTSDKTIEFSTQYSLLQQGGSPVAVGVVASIDGPNNFQGSDEGAESTYSPALGLAISRTLGSVGAIYLEPIWVNNSNPAPAVLVDDNDSILLGVGARIRILPTLYLIGEAIPRVSGYEPGVTQATFGIEKRAGGHAFQINVSNAFGTTMGQVARGGFNNDDWYLGFSISRKFF